jgi:nucleotide-binding universal stress UspA family protein
MRAPRGQEPQVRRPQSHQHRGRATAWRLGTFDPVREGEGCWAERSAIPRMGPGTREVAMTAPSRWRTSRQVVVGFDQSPQSIAALRWAASYVAGQDTLLRIVHVWDLTDAELFSAAVVAESVAADERAVVTRRVAEAIGARTPELDWQIEVLRGHVGPTLVRAADRADLLVVGTGAHTGLRRLAAGSVGHYCLSHAHCPVVAVPAPLDALAESS